MTGVPMKPLWIGDRLILARRISTGGQEYVQGCLLDWPGIKAVLQETIADLLPEADFEPVTTSATDVGRMLAVLPVRLLPGHLNVAGDGSLSPILLALAIAWTCTAMAAAAVAGLLAGVIRLSNRRASFVTAVTHELRTPLCTFQMYAEMLAEGMVSEGEQQRQYLATLRSESQRLGHLVENVLSYARLERGRADGRRESLPLGELIGRSVERLSARAAQAGMQLVLEGDQDARKSVVRANPSAVEQILFNLVDNACKYASGGSDSRLHLRLAVGREGAEVSLADHGPGVPASVGRRLFRPFSKSAAEAADSSPGVGLGLALSRRLARDMGGDLRLAAASDRGCASSCGWLPSPSGRGAGGEGCRCRSPTTEGNTGRQTWPQFALTLALSRRERGPEIPSSSAMRTTPLGSASKTRWQSSRPANRGGVLPCLDRVEAMVEEEGLYAAGWISYETAPAFDPALTVRPHDGFPLVWFGFSRRPEEISLPPVPQAARDCPNSGTGRHAVATKMALSPFVPMAISGRPL